MKPRVTYHALEEDPSCEHPVDQTVRLRVGRRDLQRIVANTSHAIVQALGSKRKVWFDYESAADELRAKREAAYSDVGVEHGIAAARANALATPSKNIRALAKRVVQEVLRTGVARREAVGAALVAAWAMLGGAIGNQSSDGTVKNHS